MNRMVAKLLARNPLSRSDPRERIVVLTYHSIHSAKSFASASPELFEQHIEWLAGYCDIVSFGGVVGALGDMDRPRPAVAITFDDGYADNHEHALPILQKYGVSATFFLTTGLIDREPEVIAHYQELQMASADEVAAMSWSQVKEMREAGMEMGGHTRTHPNLTQVPPATALLELSESKQILEERLQEPVSYTAYPFGRPKHDFTTTTMDLARQSGYQAAATINYRGVRPGDDPFAIPRFAITGDSLEILKAKVFGRLDLVGRYQQGAPQWVSRYI